MNKSNSLLAGLVFLLFSSSFADAQSFGGAFEGMSNNNEPIQIEADRLEVVDDKNTAVLSGNVSVVQGSTILKAGKITVFYLGNSSNGSASGIRKIVASGGKVAVRSQNNRATANTAVVDMQTEIVTLSGDVTISQGKNVATGCLLTVNLKTNFSELKPCSNGSSGSTGGRVKILLDPKSRQTN